MYIYVHVCAYVCMYACMLNQQQWCRNKEGSGHSDIVGKSNNSSVNCYVTTNAVPLTPSIHDVSVRQDSQGNIIGRSPENDLSNNISSSSIDTTTTTTSNTTANTTTANTTISTTSSPSNSKDNNKKGAHKQDKNIEISNSGSSGSGSSNSTARGGTSVDNNKPAQPLIRRAVVGPSFRPSKRDDAPVVGSGHTLEGGDIVWVPPTTQSGDGKTSLNSKYGY